MEEITRQEAIFSKQIERAEMTPSDGTLDLTEPVCLQDLRRISTLSRLDLRKEDLVLDIGAYDGRFLRYLRTRYGIASVGLDVSPSCMSFCSKRDPSGSYVIGDAARLPFSDNSFDCVLCGALLEHVVNPDRVIGEIYRVLKAGGQAWVYFIIKDDKYSLLWFLRDIMKPKSARKRLASLGHDYSHILNSKEYLDLMRKQGFNIIYSSRFGGWINCLHDWYFIRFVNFIARRLTKLLTKPERVDSQVSKSKLAAEPSVEGQLKLKHAFRRIYRKTLFLIFRFLSLSDRLLENRGIGHACYVIVVKNGA